MLDITAGKGGNNLLMGNCLINNMHHKAIVRKAEVDLDDKSIGATESIRK